jgi:hypothetical protein
MELTLNLVWALLAIAILWLWPRFAPRHGTDRRTQFVALAVLILVLFPVISVTDDLLATQNPAEADSCLRRNYVVQSAHTIIPVAATLPQPVFAQLSFGFFHIAAPTLLTAFVVDHPGLTAIENRPPPAA